MELSGRVFSGRGEGRKYIELSWVKQQIMEKLGFNPYPGTLNLRLDVESMKKRQLLTEDAALGVCTPEGYCTGLLFKATIEGVSCGVVIPQVEGYPDDELEVVADVNLRQRLGLSDGDRVEVTVFL
jgi:riboflavin kinase